ncbi:hypothetical protein BAUCODRAFT_123996 [Baudoinia panamericana UAMH 10762]|uniref:Uncharacterized protein n=1 Tax=Baudoinia panamericana (strain UAMH 10762) TaxID=717646 RepID=M2N6E9_BAUPA|nr:uncharacterized protein BAUCODRAFT_123996 [Baudoinia panamericana UAMH 10762]EMC94355.1 hypothetical protein BAUCODRAFT_123996 [Baudoinia panamericana UAMH 10762]
MSPGQRERQPSDYHTPAVEHWCDVVWLTWQELSAPNLTSQLRYILPLNIVTTATIGIIEQAAGFETGEWPDRTWLPDDDEFAALMGAAHGKGVARFGCQHKEVLGGN